MKSVTFLAGSFFLVFMTQSFFSGKEKTVDLLVKTTEVALVQEGTKEKTFSSVLLEVPYVSEAPEKIWTKPWGNACEEASIMMVDKYYEGSTFVGVPEAKKYLQALFDEQDRLYGSNDNSNVLKTSALIESLASFDVVVKENPTLEEIKNEIKEGRPFIAPNFGMGLYNKNIPFNPALSSFHMSVVIGFDDSKEVFIVHDPGDDETGAHHEYGYSLYMDAIHDYDEVRNKADGPMKVMFTKSR